MGSLNLEYEEAAQFSSFPLLDSHVEQGRGALEQHHQSIEATIEAPSLLTETSPFFPWEQDGVRSLQAALNSQALDTQLHGYEDIWEPAQPDELENQGSLDLSSTSSIRSYAPGVPSRVTILNPRNIVLAHPVTGMVADNPVTSERKIEAHMDRLCKVCREKAGKHSYYGGQACPSCRAFFRRSVQSGYNATYFCVKDGNCEVTLKTRKNCQYCRYKLCEAAGMKTTWVLTDEERKQKFEGRGKRKSCSSENPGEEGRNGGGEEASTAGRKVILSEEELSTVEGYVRASDY